MTECMKRGWKVSVPVGEDCRYDVIVDTPKRLCRVQVKSFSQDRTGSAKLKAAYGKSSTKTYTRKDCDVLAAYSINLKTWWIIPIHKLRGRNLNLSRSHQEYKSAWRVIPHNSEIKYKKRK